VLIADDEKEMRTLLKKAIEKVEGFETIGEAENGGRALEVIESSKPHVVFLDVEMPELDEVECAKRILEINPNTIIIFALPITFLSLEQ
jgi:two-component system LytT family response regulator